MLERTKGEVVIGGEIEGNARIAPTIVKNVPVDDSLMEECVSRAHSCRAKICSATVGKFSALFYL